MKIITHLTVITVLILLSGCALVSKKTIQQGK